MKIAIVHDHLAQDGGAEKVVQAFCEIWPEAPIYVAVYDPRNANEFFAKKEIHTSFIQRMPFGVRKYQWFFALMPSAMESFDFSEYDVVLSSTSMFAKGIITRPETLHICYCHTPTRFLWSDTHSYVAELGVNKFMQRILHVLLSRIRVWDRVAAERVHHYIANSRLVQKRISKYYHASSDIIYPPVNTERFTPVPKEEVEDYFLAGGRIVPYKRFDLLVEAFSHLGKKLKIFGDGPARAELEKRASGNVEFIGRVSDEELRHLYSHCQAFLNPQEEDFGITMIEAMASGRPVIAYSRGGASEIVDHEKTGLLVDHQSWEEFADVLLQFDHMAYDPELIRAKALTFSLEQFKKSIQEYVEAKSNEFNQSY